MCGETLMTALPSESKVLEQISDDVNYRSTMTSMVSAIRQQFA